MDGDIRDVLNSPASEAVPGESVKPAKDPSLGGIKVPRLQYT